MKLQKQPVYLPIEVEHDDECFFITDSEQDCLGAIKKEDKYVFSEEELKAFADKIVEVQEDRDDWVRSNGQGWENEQPTVKEYINNLLKQD